MKTPLDPRHKRRQKIVQDLFKIDFHKQVVGDVASEVMSHEEFIDKKIEKSAPEFPIKKINKIDLAILRLAVFELFIEKKQPPKVIIDEAVELAKEYGGEKSSSFINGALGDIVSSL
ncbi:MAG: transcription antitermination factor NusB [Patescibacteria group bacterium]|nr:transcription antitermination factor NusB [Patescibacteria group bacterium]